MQEAFNETVIKNQLQDLLRIPFYLTRLIEIFENSGTLPKSKAEIFEQLLFARMQLDVEHFRTTVELHDKQKAIIRTLERIALGMETLGRNYITDEEFTQFEANESLRTLLKYCTAWKKQEGETVTWQFEHNNFQEYLAARILSRQSLEVIQDFISFKPDYKKIIPSWVNTLSFLVSISNNSDLFRWIIESEPEIAVKFEPDKIEVTDRVRIFKEIFNNYKGKQIWIDRDKFSYTELVRFGQSDEVIDFLLTEAENAEHYTTLSNAIELLSESKIPYNQRDRTCQLLMKCALDKDKGGGIQNRALMALADLKLNSREVVDQILSILRSSDDDWVRYGLYYFLLNSDYLDENIDVFLEGIKYVRLQPSRTTKETRIGDEHWYLKIGLESARSPDAIRKIFNYFKTNSRDLDDVFLKKSISIFAEKAAVAYSEDHKLFESVLELLAILITEHMEEQGKQLIRFFDKTRTRFEAFQKVFSQKISNNYYLITLATLADEKSIELFAQEYEKQNVTESDVWTFQNYLSWENPDLYLPFNKLINEKSSNKFVLPPRRDFDKEKKQRRQSDIDLLFDKKGFLDQIKLIFDTEQKDTFTSRELSGIETHRWDNPYFSDLAIHTLRELVRDQTRSFEIVSQIVNSWDWDLFCISKLYEYLTTYEEIVILEERRVWIASWCHTSINKVNFKTALVTGPNNQSSTSWIAVYIWYFLRRLNLTYPKDVLLDMLSFDWVEGHKMLGIAYLEELLDESDITTRILKNLREGIQNNDVLKNHIDYCKRHNIKEVVPVVLDEIPNPERRVEVREIALETFCELSGNMFELEQILPKIEDDFKWSVVEQLIKRNSKYPQTFLLDILANGNEEEKLKAAAYLIQIQDLEGLKYYVEWTKKHKQFTERSFGTSPLLSLRTLESVPFLIELLKISYQEDFVQDDFHRLDRLVLDTLAVMALQSDKHYVEIKKVIENFIDQYRLVIKNVNFLYVFLEKLEQRYYISKSEKLSISDVIKKLENI